MRVEVWHKGNLQEECLGLSLISVVRFIKKPYMYSQEIIPMMLGTDITRPGHAKLTLGFLFEEARVGLMQFTLFEARSLRAIDPMGHQDPYVQLMLGETYVKRSKFIKVRWWCRDCNPLPPLLTSRNFLTRAASTPFPHPDVCRTAGPSPTLPKRYVLPPPTPRRCVTLSLATHVSPVAPPRSPHVRRTC